MSSPLDVASVANWLRRPGHPGVSADLPARHARPGCRCGRRHCPGGPASHAAAVAREWANRTSWVPRTSRSTSPAPPCAPMDVRSRKARSLPSTGPARGTVVLGSLRIVTTASDPHLHRWRGMVRLPCSIAHGVTGRNRRRCDARGPDGTGRRSTVASSRCRTGRRSPSVTCGERTPRSYATRTAGCTHDGFRSASALRARAARVRSSMLRRSASSSPAAFSAGAGGRSMTTPSPRALRSISASTRS